MAPDFKEGQSNMYHITIRASTKKVVIFHCEGFDFNMIHITLTFFKIRGHEH
jgi:hypothetical protein